MLAEFEDYYREYQTEGVGELLYGVVVTEVMGTAKHYPPEVYAPNHVWDQDAFDSVIQDFTVDWMLESGRLEYYLLSCECLRCLKAGIHSELKRYLANQKRRSEYLNLFRRVKVILSQQEAFQLFTGRLDDISASIWGLKDWTDKPIAQRFEHVLTAMYSVTLPPIIKYRADSKKLSPLLSNQDLQKLLLETFGFLDQYVGFAVLMRAVEYRLNIHDAGEVSLDQPISATNDQTFAEIYTGHASLESEVSSKLLAEELYEQLTDRQRMVLASYTSLQNPTIDEISGETGVPRTTVHNELRRVAEMIAQNSVTPDEATEILRTLGSACVRPLS